MKANNVQICHFYDIKVKCVPDNHRERFKPLPMTNKRLGYLGEEEFSAMANLIGN